ncbi:MULTISPECIES: hypothetical protein [unclassified Methanoregula]|uniref:hypothetical protein n=1 Tax=unclassified Methanoregula TaxID=2649730 RepID=UPI0009C730C1|nr:MULTISPECIES: hypothetical protein [unclassified Methanoregula]OPX64337.1 MAG: hypothetical protein A4E33_01366 [Methanoregula sp. PtaB.Bin085]OPY33538.1 MAG: hypothetical protein A4E34_01861 [Methanoregula sp. PtaU1.Bin006]
MSDNEEKNQWPVSQKEIVYLVLPLLLLAILFPTVVLQDQVFLSEYHDTLLTLNADLTVMSHPYSLWNNQWLTGLPAYADPLGNQYYPLFFPILLLTQDLFIVNFVILVHLYLAFLFFWLLAGVVTKNPEVRLISGLFYIFSGAMLARLPAGHISLLFALAWIPLLYYAFFRIVWDDELTVKNIGLIAVSMALIFFTGAVYYLFYAGLIIGVYFLWYLLKKRLGKGAIIAVFSGFMIGGMILSLKLIPLAVVSGALGRIDVIDPLGDGGSLENNLAAIIFGTPIDKVFGFYESAVLIGIIIVLLVILALIFGKEDRAIPAFFAIVAAFIWADGGNTLLSFIHLLPGLTNFRVAGRVLGALVPILILSAITGFEILRSRMESGEPLVPDPRQKRNIVYGVYILLGVKILELLFLKGITPEAGLSLLLVAAFVALLYYNQGTVKNILLFIGVAFLIDAGVVIRNALPLTMDTGVKVILIIALVIAVVVMFKWDRFRAPVSGNHYACIFLIAGLALVLLGNASYLKTSDPKLGESQALPIIEKIKSFDNRQSQIWVLDNGWGIQHMDFTYWFIKNGMHPVRAYYPYYLNTMINPGYRIGNISYYTPDYFVDTAYLDTGNQTLENVTFTVNNISVYKPDNVLPNAFVVRDSQLVPSKIETFSPDVVTISGNFMAGDIASLKASYYPGWKVNGKDAVRVGNTIGAQIPADTTTITFRFDPADMKIAMIVSGIGIILLIALVVRRRDVEKYLASAGRRPAPPAQKQAGKQAAKKKK